MARLWLSLLQHEVRTLWGAVYVCILIKHTAVWHHSRSAVATRQSGKSSAHAKQSKSTKPEGRKNKCTLTTFILPSMAVLWCDNSAIITCLKQCVFNANSIKYMKYNRGNLNDRPSGLHGTGSLRSTDVLTAGLQMPKRLHSRKCLLWLSMCSACKRPVQCFKSLNHTDWGLDKISYWWVCCAVNELCSNNGP